MFKQEYLCHYGVLGMRWGHRKGKKKTSKKVGTSKDYKRSKAIQKKSVKQMSNEELKIVTERLRLVNEFHNQASRSMKNGKHWAEAVLDKQANVYVNYLTSPGMSKKVLGAIKGQNISLPGNNIIDGSLKNIG